MNRRQAKKRHWSAHQSRRYERRVDRNFRDYWKGIVGYGTVPVSGRLIAASKYRRSAVKS